MRYLFKPGIFALEFQTWFTISIRRILKTKMQQFTKHIEFTSLSEAFNKFLISLSFKKINVFIKNTLRKAVRSIEQGVSPIVQISCTTVQAIRTTVQIISPTLQVISPTVPAACTTGFVSCTTVQTISPTVQTISPGVQAFCTTVQTIFTTGRVACSIEQRALPGRKKQAQGLLY